MATRNVARESGVEYRGKLPYTVFRPQHEIHLAFVKKKIMTFFQLGVTIWARLKRVFFTTVLRLKWWGKKTTFCAILLRRKALVFLAKLVVTMITIQNYGHNSVPNMLVIIYNRLHTTCVDNTRLYQAIATSSLRIAGPHHLTDVEQYNKMRCTGGKTAQKSLLAPKSQTLIDQRY